MKELGFEEDLVNDMLEELKIDEENFLIDFEMRDSEERRAYNELWSERGELFLLPSEVQN